MSEAEHRAAVRTAATSDREFKRLFARMGSVEHPNGRILRLYRVARRGVAGAQSGGLRYNGVAAAQAGEVLVEFRNGLWNEMRAILETAQAVGVAQARAQLGVYGLAATSPATGMEEQLQAALTAWMAVADGQVAAVQAALATGAEQELILGDGTQPGMLNPAPVNREGSKWVGVVAIGAFLAWLDWILRRPRPGSEFQKQVVAAIDERTTECCLRAHGQVRRMNEDFQLTGSPRYADRLQWTPFHWYCRSSVALVRRQDAGDDLTQQMIEAALAELRARTDGSRVEIHPAHGRSRR